MKIKSSTKWCNIYSNASKFNVVVHKSCDKLIAYTFLVTVIALFCVAIFTNQYLLCIGIAALGITIIGFLINPPINSRVLSFMKSEHRSTPSQLLISQTGEVKLDNSVEHHQLQSNSRVSFIGCWLVLQPTSMANHLALSKGSTKEVFLFKSSISKRDYARIANVINQL